MVYSIGDMNPARNKYAIGTIILLTGISLHYRLAGLQAPIRKPTSLDHPEATAIIKLEFGLKHPEPRTWNGSASISAGEILNTWGWHFSSPDRINGTAAWQFEAREYNPSDQRYRTGFDLPGGVKVLPNGVYIALNAQDSAEIAIRGNRGDFSFRLSDLKSNGSMPFLGGDVRAVYTPPTRALTRGEASQHDFPSIAALGDDLFIAWVTYHNEGNVLYLARRRDGEWSTHRVTPNWGDYYGSAVAADSDGLVHVIWSEYGGDRWRLVDRAFDPDNSSWKSRRYISPEGHRQIFPRAVSDAGGNPWVVWQEFIGANFDIMASRWNNGGWLAPVRVSQSKASDWTPAIAAGLDGRIYITWDSYQDGNYDIFLREFRDGNRQPIIQVTRAATRDAYATVAVDLQNRVWLAWAEAPENWGKDWGVLGKPGNHFRTSSRIRLARYADGKFTEPPTALEDAVPAWMSSLHEYPQLAIGANGLPLLFFRKVIDRFPVEEHETLLKFGAETRRMQPWYDTIRSMSSIQMMAFDGAVWSAPRELPLSVGGAYAQTGAAVAGGKLAVVWPADGRTYEDPHFRTSQLRYTELELNAATAGDDRMVAFRSEPGDAPDAAPTEKEDLARIRAVRWEDTEPLKLYRGDLHRHTDLSADSIVDGDILLAYRYAYDAASLDFLAVTDHSGAQKFHYYQYQWWRNRQIATMFNQPGHFATFFGYERTVTYPGGHRNVISTRRDMQPVWISDEEFFGKESWAERLYPSLLKGGDIAIAHTVATGGGTDWRDGDPRAEPVVEIFQGLRGSYEEPNTPAKGMGMRYDAGLVWSAWAKGRKLGVITSSDHTSTHQSYACVYAPELTSEAILNAIKKRRTFGATDNIIVKLDAVTSAGEVYKMGQELSDVSAPKLRASIEGTQPLASVELIRNGKILLARNPGQPSDTFEFRDNDPLNTEAYYYLRIVQKDKQLAWSSPIWVTIE